MSTCPLCPGDVARPASQPCCDLCWAVLNALDGGPMELEAELSPERAALLRRIIREAGFLAVAREPESMKTPGDLLDESGLPANVLGVTPTGDGRIVVLGPLHRVRLRRGDALNLAAWLCVHAGINDETLATALALARNA